VRQSIRGYTDGVLTLAAPSGESSLTTLVGELAAVRSVLDGSDDLRRVMSDPGVPVAARRGVLADLFGSQVGASTMRLLNFVVDSDRATEVVADIGWLAERFEAAGRRMEPVGDVVLGHHGAVERVEGFATAVLDSVDGDRALAEIEDELFRFSRVVIGSVELSGALADRDLPVSARRGLVADLLQAKASAATTAMATYATQIGRPRDYEDLLAVLVSRVAAESNRRLADVRSAVEMDDTQQRNLAAALGRAIGHDVEVRVSVDPTLLAGFVATIGDTVVDGSARHHLDLLKERLVMPEANITTGERH
jgi:F-type H+-transporting ATPase subunit delta